jgi:hypothetical protein
VDKIKKVCHELHEFTQIKFGIIGVIRGKNRHRLENKNLLNMPDLRENKPTENKEIIKILLICGKKQFVQIRAIRGKKNNPNG